MPWSRPVTAILAGLLVASSAGLARAQDADAAPLLAPPAAAPLLAPPATGPLLAPPAAAPAAAPSAPFA